MLAQTSSILKSSRQFLLHQTASQPAHSTQPYHSHATTPANGPLQQRPPPCCDCGVQDKMKQRVARLRQACCAHPWVSYIHTCTPTKAPTPGQFRIDPRRVWRTRAVRANTNDLRGTTKAQLTALLHTTPGAHKLLLMHTATACALTLHKIQNMCEHPTTAATRSTALTPSFFCACAPR